MTLFKLLIILMSFFSLPVVARGAEQGGDHSDNTRYFGAVRQVNGAALAGYQVQQLDVVQYGYEIPKQHLFMTLEGTAVIEDRFGGRVHVAPFTNIKITETGLELEKGALFITDLTGRVKLPSGVSIKTQGSEGIVRFQPQHGDFNILALTGNFEVMSAAENLTLKSGYFVTGKDYKTEWSFPEQIALSSAGEQIDFFKFDTQEKERMISYIKVTRFADKRNVAMNPQAVKQKQASTNKPLAIPPAETSALKDEVKEVAVKIPSADKAVDDSSSSSLFAKELAEIKKSRPVQKTVSKSRAATPLKAVKPVKKEAELLLTDSGHHAQGVNPGSTNEFKNELVRMKKKRMGWRFYLPHYSPATVEITDIGGISHTASTVGYIDGKVVNNWKIKSEEELAPEKESTIQEAKAELMNYVKTESRMPASVISSDSAPLQVNYNKGNSQNTEAAVVTVPVSQEYKKLTDNVEPVNTGHSAQIWRDKEETPMGVRADAVMSVKVATPDRLNPEKNKGPRTVPVKALSNRAPASVSKKVSTRSPASKVQTESAKGRLIQRLRSFKSFYQTDEDRRRHRITSEDDRSPASVDSGSKKGSPSYNDDRFYGEPSAPDLSENF